MTHRAAFAKEATAKRHARGEIYSKGRVVAINAMGPSKAEMESDIQRLYLRQPDAAHVLMAHARVHFVHGLMSSRLLLRLHTPDIMDAARTMQRHEEEFAAAWVASLRDAGFQAELRRLQRQALQHVRTSTCAMFFVTQPAFTDFSDMDAQALGKAWNKLDEIAQTLGVEPLSAFIALPDEGDSAGVPGSRFLPTVEVLIRGLQSAEFKLPSKRAAVVALTKIRAAALQLPEAGAAWFEVDN
ncbi:MAG: hypothetical protein H7Y28_08615 [Rhodoferax sp.]|nr:hypothetical protein [Rhodoferax sp.]